jgi:sarcosine oxidase subunit gamma
MSEPAVRILPEPDGAVGMVTLRADLAAPAVAAALAAFGTGVPAQRRIIRAGDRAAGWMSPDEMLLVMPGADAAAVLGAVQAALAGTHHLAVDVSDARALFRLRGSGWRETLARLMPVDLHPDVFGPGELRRTRLAQVACAVWISGADEASVVCFRSVSRYVADLLDGAAGAPAAGLY